MNLPITDLGALVAYCAAMSATPGPNNTMLASLGARYGLRATAPAALGVTAGMVGLIVAASLGVDRILEAAPGLRLGLAVVGVAYMAYFAWLLWSADHVSSAHDRPPVGFFGAVALQAVNPKALLLATTIAGTFLAPGAGPAGPVALAGVFAAVGLPCIAAWAFAGDRLQGWLARPGRALLFSRVMAVLLALTAFSILTGLR